MRPEFLNSSSTIVATVALFDQNWPNVGLEELDLLRSSPAEPRRGRACTGVDVFRPRMITGKKHEQSDAEAAKQNGFVEVHRATKARLRRQA